MTITKIVVEQAEGLATECRPATYVGSNCVEQANAHLSRIAANGPDLGYYKTDVTITLVDGTDYQFRFDVCKAGVEDNDTDVMRHAVRMFECYGGLKVPFNYRDKFTQPQWEALMIDRHGAEAMMELRRLLGVLTGVTA